MTADVELLPCPFCGGADVDTQGTGGDHYATCQKASCGIGPDATTRSEAIAAWNRRATAAKDVEIEALRDEIAMLRVAVDAARLRGRAATGTIEALRAEVGLLRRGNVAYSQQVADLIGRAGCAEAHAERLAEALREAAHPTAAQPGGDRG